MKLHAYLEQVVGSKTAIALVRTLLTYRGMTFTVRRLAQMAAVSPSETSHVLKELEESGVVKILPVGRSFLITLNDESYVLQKVLKPIIQAEKETVDELVRAIREEFQRENAITSAFLFGSVVRNEEKKDSDIDLLVVSKDYERAVDAVSRVQERVAISLNKQVSPLIFEEKEFRRRLKRKSDLIDSISKNHILVIGKEIFSK